MEDFKVLIVGSGITGLLLAQALKKANIKHAIFEAEVSADAYQLRQWGMSIHWSTPLLKKILPEELWDRIHEPQCDPFYKNPDVEILNIYDGTTGEKMTAMHEPHHIRFNRAKLRAFCAQGIDVQYNKKIISTTLATKAGQQSVTAVFEDGTSATGSMMVGADGSSSKVRKLLFGDDRANALPASTPDNPFIFTNSAVQYPKAEQAVFLRQLHPTFYAALHPKGGFFWISPLLVLDIDDPSTWTFQMFANWRGKAPADRRNVLPELKAWASELIDPWKSAIEWLPEDTVIETQRIQYWHPIERDNKDGRITLAGDAAHPMVPFRGQGLGHCVADVASLVEQLQTHLKESKPLAEAVADYDKEVIARAGDEVKVSYQTMNFLFTWDLVNESPSFKRSADPNEAALKIIGKA